MKASYNCTGTYAKNRLLNIIISDRFSCNSGMINEIKDSLSKTLSSYIDFDPKEVDIQINDRVLYASIPVSLKNNRKEKRDYYGNGREEVQTNKL